MLQNRKHFIEELEDLNYKVAQMGDEVIKAYNQLIKLCNTQDKDFANEIIKHDEVINEIEVSINVDAYLLIAKQCPVASDLRRIITALKISNDLERIGDYVSNIAKYIQKTQHDNEQHVDGLIELIEQVIQMLESIMSAFQNENLELALNVTKEDEVLDSKYKEFVKDLIQIGKKTTDEEAEEAMRAVLVFKQLERAGDHIVNIAEGIVYLVNGKRVELD